MKKTVALLTMLIGGSSLLLAQTADDIINKNIAAMGGMDKLQSMKSTYQEDSLNESGVKIPVKIWMVDKKAMRAEFSFNGMTGYQVLRNDSGWSFMPFQGQTKPEPMTADQVKKGHPYLYLTDAFVNYKEKGYKVTYEGKDETEGSESYKVKVTISDSISETYFIDPDTYYVIQVKSKVSVNGKVGESTETRSNYKKNADGYIFPMEVNSSDHGDIKTYIVKVNAPIDNAVFTPTVKVAGK